MTALAGVLVGPTASGKSRLAVTLAQRAGDVDIVSVDAMAVYRGMDVGTATPPVADRGGVPHHLIDVVDPWESFTVADYQRHCNDVLDDLAATGRRALLVGGTGLYVRAVVDGLTIPGQYPEVRAELDVTASRPGGTEELWRQLGDLDPVAAGRMEPTNRRRVVRALEVTLGSGQPFSSFGPGLDVHPTAPCPLVGLEVPRNVLDARIADRVAEQLASGWVEEVRALAADPRGLSPSASQALGYQELLGWLAAGGDDADPDGSALAAAVEAAVTRTRRFARRQQRWFRRDPRITWVDATNPAAPGVVDAVAEALGWGP